MNTINRIEVSLKSQADIDKTWHEIRYMFLKEMESLPNIRPPECKNLKKAYRKMQPFWNDDLANLWFSACQAEKNYPNFKVNSAGDLKLKEHLGKHLSMNNLLLIKSSVSIKDNLQINLRTTCAN